MELFLNVLWVLIAIHGLVVWQLVWKRQARQTRPEPFQEWTAFACALVFLFFAVSLSDDLHADVILADDCVRGRHALVWACSHASAQNGVAVDSSVGAVPSRSGLSLSLRDVERIAPAIIHLVCHSEADPSAGRSPPFPS
jgi:hypothetical protein